MMERYYRFAGITFRVVMDEDMMYTQERKLAPFAVEKTQNAYNMEFFRTDALLPPSGSLLAKTDALLVYRDGETQIRYKGKGDLSPETAYFRGEYGKNGCRIQLNAAEYPHRVGPNSVLETMAAEHWIARNDGFIFHCAYIVRSGRAILFTAPSGTGKSTQAELWHTHRDAEIINGDRAAVRLAEGILLAEGIPFSGSSPYCKNRSLPVEAIVYLGQAPETTIRRLRGYEAFSRIWEGISVNAWDKEDLDRVSNVVRHAVEKIPVFFLRCRPDVSAVEALEQYLGKTVKK